MLEHRIVRRQTCLLSKADTEGGGGGRVSGPHPEKSQNIRVSRKYWSGTPEKSQSYQASIQCWAIIDPPAKHHLNGISPFKWHFAVGSMMAR